MPADIRSFFGGKSSQGSAAPSPAKKEVWPYFRDSFHGIIPFLRYTKDTQEATH